jgi:hypothetical protein
MEDAEASTAGLLSEFPREMLMAWFRENPDERMEILLGWLPIVEKQEGGGLRWNTDLEHFVAEHATRPEQLSVIASCFHPRSCLGEPLPPHFQPSDGNTYGGQDGDRAIVTPTSD